MQVVVKEQEGWREMEQVINGSLRMESDKAVF